MSENSYIVSSLAKSFQILELMSHKERWDLRELVRVAKLSKVTVQRILLTLEGLGYVQHEHRGGAYKLTVQFFKLGCTLIKNNKLIEIAKDSCRTLMQTVNETVNVCMALGKQMIIVEQQQPYHYLRIDSIIGSSFPIYPSASGKLWLAFQSEQDAITILRSLQHKPLSTQELISILEELTRIRTEGIAFDYEELFKGVHCLAAPVFDYSGTIVATLSCSVPIVRVNEENSQRLIREVSHQAQLLSRQLGAIPHIFQATRQTLLARAQEA